MKSFLLKAEDTIASHGPGAASPGSLPGFQALFSLGPAPLLPAQVCVAQLLPFFPQPSFLGPPKPDSSCSVLKWDISPWK